MRKRISRSFLFVLLFCAGFVFAQQPAQDQDAEKLKAERRAKLITAIMREAAELTLPENSALVSARLGAAIWKEDPERAGSLFRNAVASLIAAQSLAEASKNSPNRPYDLLNSQSVRPTILNSIAAADAEFALEGLYKSRPLAVQRALAQRTSGTKFNDGSSNYMQLAQQEINLEQRFIRMVAEQKPQRSTEMLKESIKKQLSGETLAMLKKLWEKEPAAANELANDVVDRLISASFGGPNNQMNHELLNVSNAILTEFIRERPAEEKGLAFDESRMRALAQKLIAAYIEHGPRMGYIPLPQLEPIAKRLSSSVLFAQLKKVAESTRGFGHVRHLQEDAEYSKLLASNPTADMLLAEAKRFPPETRRSLYQNAANKLSDAGQYERALALLNDQFEGDALENAISGLNWYHAHLLVQRGDFDQAESMMMQLNDGNRISALISLATTVFYKDQKENRARANGILQRVRSLMAERPETSTDFSQLFQLIGVMATVEPVEAFRNLEPMVGRVNEVTEAFAVVNAYQGGNIRSGEYSLVNGYNMGVYLEPSILRTLAQNDFSRAMAMIDGLSRREMRIMIWMTLLENGV